jgi:hypothetical protein
MKKVNQTKNKGGKRIGSGRKKADYQLSKQLN